MSKPKLFATINGIKVYHAHKHGYGRGREMNYQYSTAQSPESAHFEQTIDIRDLGFSERTLLDLQDQHGIDEGYELFLDSVKEFLKKHIAYTETQSTVSVLAEIPEKLHNSVQSFLEDHPGKDIDQVITAAVSLYLLQNSNADRDYRPAAARIYLDSLFKQEI